MGVIAAGHLADMVVLERDPVADIANMRSILFTVKRGHRFDRADYRPITARRRAMMTTELGRRVFLATRRRRGFGRRRPWRNGRGRRAGRR